MITGKKAAAASVICTFMENMIPRYSTIRKQDSKHLRQLPAHKVTDHFHVRGTSLNDLPGLVLYMPGTRQILGCGDTRCHGWISGNSLSLLPGTFYLSN